MRIRRLNTKKEIGLLKRNHHRALENMYTKYRNSFLKFAKKYGVDQDTLIAIYQNAFIAVREQAIKGTLDPMKSSIKTYLFSTGKYMIYHYLQSHKKIAAHPSTIDFKEIATIGAVFEEPTLTPKQRSLQRHFKKLGKRCQEVLTLFYYRELTIDEITKSLGYENRSVVKKQKSHCLKSLKKLLKSRRTNGI